MNTISYSFTMAMLHSLWQGAGLWLLYKVFAGWLPSNQPLARRNLLFITLLTQLGLFILTAFIYYTAPAVAPTLLITDAVGLPDDRLAIVTTGLFYTYLFVIGYKCMKAIYTWFRFRQLSASGLQKPGIELRFFTEQRALHYGIKKKVKLWFSSTIQTPVTFGYFKPVILLPLALVNHISVQQAETLILHELAHIRNNDYLLNWLLLATENIFFFNPFVRWCCNQVRLEREKNCDLNVIAFDYPATSYAETLLMAERIRQTVPAFQLAAVQQKQQLLQRIRFFCQQEPASARRRFRIALPLLTLLTGGLLLSSVLFFTQRYALTGKGLSELSYTGNLSAPATASLPVKNNTELALKKIVNNITLKMAPVLAANGPVLEKKIKDLAPVINKFAEKAEAFGQNLEKQFAVTPVAQKEIDSVGSEIIVQEENTGINGAALKVYRMIYRNGEWKMVPEWMATSREINNDSAPARRKKDSSRRRVLEAQ